MSTYVPNKTQWIDALGSRVISSIHSFTVPSAALDLKTIVKLYLLCFLSPSASPKCFIDRLSHCLPYQRPPQTLFNTFLHLKKRRLGEHHFSFLLVCLSGQSHNNCCCFPRVSHRLTLRRPFPSSTLRQAALKIQHPLFSD